MVKFKVGDTVRIDGHSGKVIRVLPEGIGCHDDYEVRWDDGYPTGAYPGWMFEQGMTMNDDPNERYATVKSPAEIEKMRASCRLAANALAHTVTAVRPGISTGELDKIAFEYIVGKGARPSSLGYRGFPKSICTSVNDVVCHGIPSRKEILKEGDIINIDIAVLLDGYHGDNSITVPVGTITPRLTQLLHATVSALHAAIAHVKPDIRTRELGGIIEDHVRTRGFSSVREFVGHGVGRGYHEPPSILHYRNMEPAMRLRPGMTFTIEPMINVGGPEVVLDPVDRWTVRTADGSPSAQFEHTLLVTEQGCEILTIASELYNGR